MAGLGGEGGKGVSVSEISKFSFVKEGRGECYIKYIKQNCFSYFLKKIKIQLSKNGLLNVIDWLKHHITISMTPSGPCHDGIKLKQFCSTIEGCIPIVNASPSQ